DVVLQIDGLLLEPLPGRNSDLGRRLPLAELAAGPTRAVRVAVPLSAARDVVRLGETDLEAGVPRDLRLDPGLHARGVRDDLVVLGVEADAEPVVRLPDEVGAQHLVLERAGLDAGGSARDVAVAI